MCTRFCVVTLILLLVSPADADTILVPADHPTIQAAIDAAVDGDCILVSPGTYDCINFEGKAITVRSAEGPEVTTIVSPPSPSCFSVQFNSGELNDSVLDGFTLTGAGVNCFDASPTIQNNYIVDCVAGGLGIGGNWDPPEPALVINNLIAGNGPQQVGGGIVISQPAIVEGNAIINNLASSPDPQRGGGVYVDLSSGESVELRNNLIAGNEVLGCCAAGGGIYVEGGGLTTIEGCTIVGNYAEVQGGGVLLAGIEEVHIRSSILWGNDAPFDPQLFESGLVFDMEYSTIQGGWPGLGNLDLDPGFVSGPAGEYYLAPASPAIDAGDPTVVPTPGITTQADQTPDTGTIDQGYHYPIIALPEFVRADCNADGALDISDAIFALEVLFLPGSAPTGTTVACAAACDSNGSGVIDIADPVYALTYLFSLGAAPPAPFPDCGTDPVIVGGLGCDGGAACP